MNTRILPFLLLIASANALKAQDLEYTLTTRGKFSGVMGGAGNAVLGPEQAASARVYLKGAHVRVELGQNPFLLDASRQEMIVLDAARKTYSTVALKDLPTRSDTAVSAAAGAATVAVTAGRTAERVNGLSAHHTTVLVRVPARNPRATRATDLVLVSELWTTNQNGFGTAYERVAGVLGRSGLGGSLLTLLAAQNPRMAAAMQLALKRLDAVHGLPLRRSNVFGSVKAGARFTPGMPMDTLMSTHVDITDVKVVGLPPALFEVPRGYGRR